MILPKIPKHYRSAAKDNKQQTTATNIEILMRLRRISVHVQHFAFCHFEIITRQSSQKTEHMVSLQCSSSFPFQGLEPTVLNNPADREAIYAFVDEYDVMVSTAFART